MNVAQFIAKWGRVALTERSAFQQHFLDLCEALDHPKPAEADPIGQSFTFERGATKTGAGDGWADVWKRGFFGWEYKGKHKDLNAAYQQLLKYREALENPPLLVVCDMDRIIVHTNFTNSSSTVHEIALEELSAPRSLEILRHVFFEPDKLKPGATSEAITQETASQLVEIAQSLRDAGHDPSDVAHFLDRIIFSLSAEGSEVPIRSMAPIGGGGVPGIFILYDENQVWLVSLFGTPYFVAEFRRRADSTMKPVLFCSRDGALFVAYADGQIWGASARVEMWEREISPAP